MLYENLYIMFPQCLLYLCRSPIDLLILLMQSDRYVLVRNQTGSHELNFIYLKNPLDVD